jgi:putative N6-adenine-specific DNA methylase
VPLPAVLPCFAITTPGIESLLTGELTALGVVLGASEPGGVEFMATRRQLADALLGLRTANRVTVRMATFHARSFGELERHATNVAWGDVIAPGATVHFRVTSKMSKLYHDGGIAERLERAAADSMDRIEFVRSAGEVGKIEEEDVRIGRIGRVQRIVVRVMRDEVTLSADAAGALLYLRGYRQAVAKAPLRETLAAALLLASGWNPELPLLDPMCGSGTIAIEAVMIARQMAPGRARRFAAEKWPRFADAFVAARASAAAAEMSHAAAAIVGQDRDAGAIEASIANAERAGVSADVEFRQAPISALTANAGAGWLVTNPPYGARIGERTALRDLYAVLGRVMRERRPGWALAMLSADRMLEGQLGMPMEEVLRTTNGGLPVRVVRAAGLSS